MEKTINDGGPAFPTKREYQHGAGTGYEQIEGMSLRDWFAGQALQGLTSVEDNRTCPTERRRELYAADAECCYQYADAMLAARANPAAAGEK